MWSAGCLAAFSAITYPAITALVSKNAEDDQQGIFILFALPQTVVCCDSTTGAVQGIVTGIRGLCNGLGPAAFGLLFGLFHVDLTEPHDAAEARNQTVSSVRVNSVIVCISGNYNKLSLCAFPRKCLGLLFCLGPY